MFILRIVLILCPLVIGGCASENFSGSKECQFDDLDLLFSKPESFVNQRFCGDLTLEAVSHVYEAYPVGWRDEYLSQRLDIHVTVNIGKLAFASEIATRHGLGDIENLYVEALVTPVIECLEAKAQFPEEVSCVPYERPITLNVQSFRALPAD